MGITGGAGVGSREEWNHINTAFIYEIILKKKIKHYYQPWLTKASHVLS